MMDNVTALKMCSTVHDHWRETEDTTNAMTESQKIAEHTQLETIKTHFTDYARV